MKFRRPTLRPLVVLATPCVALLLAVVATVACAEVPGQGVPRFQAALERWLADDEAAALPEFAALAAEGNRAAQILLALVDTMPETQGPWLAGQPRGERVAILRRPGGISSQRWMPTAAEDSPLAGLWLARWDVATTTDTAIALAAMGELRAARETLLALAGRQRHGFAAIADDPLYPPALRYLAWQEWRSDPVRKPGIGAEIEEMLPGDPQIRLHDARPVRGWERDEWLARDPLVAPLRAFCAAACPDTAAACTRATFRLVGGYTGLATAGTPSETLIPPAAWDASPRGRAAILRRAEARDPITGPALAREVAGLDACAGAALAAETARFGG